MVTFYRARRYRPEFYWLVVIATTTVGTTTSDMLDRTFKLGYVGSSAMELALVIGVLAAWLLLHRIDPNRQTFHANERNRLLAGHPGLEHPGYRAR